jgi:hypothetical protein
MKNMGKSLLLIAIVGFSSSGAYAGNQADSFYKKKIKEIPDLTKKYNKATGQEAANLEAQINGIFQNLKDNNTDPVRKRQIEKLENAWIKMRSQNRSAMGAAAPAASARVAPIPPAPRPAPAPRVIPAAPAAPIAPNAPTPPPATSYNPFAPTGSPDLKHSGETSAGSAGSSGATTSEEIEKSKSPIEKAFAGAARDVDQDYIDRKTAADKAQRDLEAAEWEAEGGEDIAEAAPLVRGPEPMTYSQALDEYEQAINEGLASADADVKEQKAHDAMGFEGDLAFKASSSSEAEQKRFAAARGSLRKLNAQIGKMAAQAK